MYYVLRVFDNPATRRREPELRACHSIIAAGEFFGQILTEKEAAQIGEEFDCEWFPIELLHAEWEELGSWHYMIEQIVEREGQYRLRFCVWHSGNNLLIVIRKLTDRELELEKAS